MPNTDSIKLASPDAFKAAVKKVLSNSKRESDKQLAKLQAANAKKHEAKK